MSRSVNVAAAGTHGKSLAVDLGEIPTRPARMGIDGNSDEFTGASGDGRNVVREAMHGASHSQKAFAIDAKAGEAKVSEGMSGQRHLPWEWIYRQKDPSFRRQFVRSLAEAWGVHEDAEDAELEALTSRLVQQVMRVTRRRRSA
jgi:hypothetical protein